MGVFESMPALCVATNVAELYNSVLVETPLAPYFSDCLSAEDLDEMNIEIIRNTLYKAYLEDFYHFSQSFGGPTAEIMGELLQVNIKKYRAVEHNKLDDRMPFTATTRSWKQG